MTAARPAGFDKAHRQPVAGAVWCRRCDRHRFVVPQSPSTVYHQREAPVSSNWFLRWSSWVRYSTRCSSSRIPTPKVSASRNDTAGRYHRRSGFWPRRSLYQRIGPCLCAVEHGPSAADAMNGFQTRALDLLTSGSHTACLADRSTNRLPVRDAYGPEHLWPERTCSPRRLIEAGTRMV